MDNVPVGQARSPGCRSIRLLTYARGPGRYPQLREILLLLEVPRRCVADRGPSSFGVPVPITKHVRLR